MKKIYVRKGVRNYIYVEKKMENENKTHISKECPPGKIISPKTEKCIKDKTNISKECPPDKIIIPKTG